MFKLVSKIFNQTKPFNKSLTEICQSSFTPKYQFNTYTGDQDLLRKHHLELKLYQYRKTQMKAPDSLVKINMETVKYSNNIELLSLCREAF